MISSEGFEPVPDPEIMDSPGRGLAVSGKHVHSSSKHQSSARPKHSSSHNNDKPHSSRQNKALSQNSSARSIKTPQDKKDIAPANQTTNKVKTHVATFSTPASKQTESRDVLDDRTDVTINPSDYDTDIVEEDKTDLDLPPQRGITVKQEGAQSEKTLLTLSTEQTQLLRDVMKELDTAKPGGRSVKCLVSENLP